MRRVLHLRSSGGMLGAEQVIMELCRHSSRHGYQPMVATIGDAADGVPELVTEAQRLGVEALAIQSNGRVDLAALRQLRAVITSRGIDLVHCHGYREDVSLLLADRRVRRIATNHLWKLTDWRLRAYAALDALALRQFPRVVAVSAEIARDMHARGIPASAICVIPNGISTSRVRQDDSARMSVRARLGLHVADTAAVMVSSLSPEKGHDIAIEALRLVHDRGQLLHLVVVGAGATEAALRAQVARLSLTSQVHFVGWQRDVAPYLAAADFFVMSSRQEGLPIALLEAMGSGLAVVATDVGEIPGVLSHGGGLLVKGLDPGALASALLALASDPPLRQQLAGEARQVVQREFSGEAMTERYCREYDGLFR